MAQLALLSSVSWCNVSVAASAAKGTSQDGKSGVKVVSLTELLALQVTLDNILFPFDGSILIIKYKMHWISTILIIKI